MTFIKDANLEAKTRQAMYEYRDTEEPSRIHCCHAKAMSITYSECESVA